MNYLDLILIAPLVLGAVMGFKKGLVIEIASLLALVLGVFGAMKFSFYISKELSLIVDWSPQLIHMASLILTFIGIVLLVRLIARGVERIVKMVALGIVNRITGAIFGATKYLIILAILIYAVEIVNEKYPFIKNEFKEASLLYKPIASAIPLIYPSLEDYLEEFQ